MPANHGTKMTMNETLRQLIWLSLALLTAGLLIDCFNLLRELKVLPYVCGQ